MTAPNPLSAQLRLSRLVGDGMVMQRNASVPVWGWARPGQDVVVTFDRKTHRAKADASGHWKVTLPPRGAGGPHQMTVAANGQRVQVRDILIGDVWLASGQSNIEWTVADSRNAAQEIAAARDPRIRHFKVPQSWAPAPEETLAGGEWKVANPANVGDFSAVGYFFARELRKHVDVPIGLINASWGGSRIEPWMSADALQLGENALETVMQQERAHEESVLQKLRAKIGDLPTHDAGLATGRALWADPALDDGRWDRVAVPGLWEAAGYEGMDGIGWYRTNVDLTEQEARAGVRLGLGMIDDSDISWVNGHEVGRTAGWNEPRVYDVPASALRAGRNVVAIRVEDTGGGGGIHGGPELLYVETPGGRRPLAGAWKFKVGAVSVSTDGRKNQLPTLLFNKMIHPLLPYPIKGALWYQGESNASPNDALRYREHFTTLIRDWRTRWGVGDFPFLWVQLANFMQPDSAPSESAWALLRESQSAALTLPNTGQAVAIDIGEAGDIHPRNKQDVGLRLALAARKVAYGQDIVHSGPAYRAHEVSDGRIVVSFDHAGGGLLARGQEKAVREFAIAGPDRRFVWANAEIQGDRVVVWSDRVSNPVAVRYAWGDNPEGANLYNREGLPASPFRTDRW